MDVLAAKATADDIDPETGEIKEPAPKKAAAKPKQEPKPEPAPAPKEERIASDFAREVEQEAAPASDPGEMPSFLRRSAPKTNGGFSGFSDD